jgi:GTP cyclohydrolase IA
MSKKPSQEEAEQAVRTLIKWAGDNPDRKEIIDTPARVVKSYKEFFSGYEKDDQYIKTFKVFENNSNYDEMILLHNIRMESVCEHHMVPIIGYVSVAYYPDKKIIGLSKLARIVDICSKKLQLQERLTVEIAQKIELVTEPLGVAVFINSSHQCMTTRGVHKTDASMQTTYMTGKFKQQEYKQEFLNNIKK